ncbi:MAG: TIGR02281 family clan AA aspartic protease [Burkholderiales bacterium]|nr:TIGR02281 family clan AA aspartic protease [Burkholderiales bacterium]
MLQHTPSLRALAWALACAAAACGSAWAAPAVTLAGMLGGKALLVVDGSPPKGVAPGQTHLGVKVLSVARDEAVIEIDGRQSTLRVGEAPVSVGRRSGMGQRIVLQGDSRGHFIQQGLINGRVIQFMVDTGATTVAIGRPDAERMGLPYQKGQAVMLNTANGATQGWRLRLDSVRIGDVEVFQVDAIVTPQAMPYVLLGNSFLGQFQMTRTNDQMVLEKRN